MGFDINVRGALVNLQPEPGLVAFLPAVPKSFFYSRHSLFFLPSSPRPHCCAPLRV